MPFDLLPPREPGRFGREPDWNAFVELHNVVAAAASPYDYGPSDRVRISERRGVDLSREFLADRRALYQTLLDHRLADGDLSGDDRRALDHLARTLALGPDALRPVHERAFGVAVTAAVADDCLSVEERLLLFKLQHLLGLDPRVADGAYDVLARERLLRVVAGALCDGELSPEEEAEIERVRRALSLDPPEGFEAMLERARFRHRTRHGALPAVDPPFPLPEGETARFEGGVRWGRVAEARLRAALGAGPLQSGKTGALHVPDRALSGRLATGEVVLSDRRILLRSGAAVPDVVRLAALRQILRFRNGTVVRTKADRFIYIDPGDRNEAFYAVLHRLVFGDRARAPEPARAPGSPLRIERARWRRVLDAEERRRAVRWFGQLSQRELAERLVGARVAWPGAGTVSVTANHLVLRQSGGRLPERERSSLDTVVGVVRHEAFVWVRRRHAHNWLVACATETDAKRLEARLVATL